MQKKVLMSASNFKEISSRIFFLFHFIFILESYFQSANEIAFDKEKNEFDVFEEENHISFGFFFICFYDFLLQLALNG